MSTLLFFLLTIVASQDNPKVLHPEFSVESYQESVMPGDTFYFRGAVKNPHAESVYISIYELTRITMYLRDSEKQIQPLLFEDLPFYASIPLRFTEIKPGPYKIFTWRINVPPLEDIKEPFWEKHLKNLSEKEEKLWLCDETKKVLLHETIRRTVVLTGTRRVGKTTIQYQMIDSLL